MAIDTKNISLPKAAKEADNLEIKTVGDKLIAIYENAEGEMVTKTLLNKSLKELSAGASRKALLESIARVTEDIGIDKRAGIIEQEIAKKFKEGKMDKPPKPKPSMTLKGGKLVGVKDAPEERRKETVTKGKDGGSVISMKDGGVPTEYKGFSMLPETVQEKMDPQLAQKYKKGGSVNKKTGIKRRITIKGMGIAKRGF